MFDENIIKKFGELVDDILTKSDVGMLVRFPKGTLTPTIEDNIELGPVLQFYMLLNALEVVFRDVLEQAKVDPEKKEALIDGLLALVKNDLMDAKEAKG